VRSYCYDVACRQNESDKKATQIITYHLGRLTAYDNIALLFWSAGKVFSWPVYNRIYPYSLGHDCCSGNPEKIFMKYNFSKPVF
jgi:hypothetical protein